MVVTARMVAKLIVILAFLQKQKKKGFERQNGLLCYSVFLPLKILQLLYSWTPTIASSVVSYFVEIQKQKVYENNHFLPQLH